MVIFKVFFYPLISKLFKSKDYSFKLTDHEKEAKNFA